jgi:hypothetical protein
MKVRPIRICIVALVALTTPVHASEFQAVTAALHASYDVGTLSVPDTDRGTGGGVALRAGFGDRDISWEVGVELVAFERLTLAFSQGDPSTDFINGLGVELAVRFGRR